MLFIQTDIADNTLEMLAGAMASLKAGDPRLLCSDLGPVIDNGARTELQKHIDRMHKEATFIASVALEDQCADGSFIPPHVFEIRSLDQLTEEVFGPVLHVIRYSSDQLGAVIQQINDTGYGLTLGIHSRIQAFTETVFRNTIAGNTYINRNMVGAVVGVNPFGGRGLSGTGPKAGGPNYLLRYSGPLMQPDTQPEPQYAWSIKRNPQPHPEQSLVTNAAAAMAKWQATAVNRRLEIIGKCQTVFASQLAVIAREKLGQPTQLPGPTGEDNKLSLHGRGLMVLIVRQQDSLIEAQKQIVAALLCGIPIHRTNAATFILAGILGGFAGCLLAASVGVLSPLLTLPLTVKGLIVTVIGGLGSIRGAIIAGFAVGAAEGIFLLVRGVNERDIYVFLLLFLFLVLRPNGLFGTTINRD